MAAVIGALRAELSASISRFQQDMGKAGDSVAGFSNRFKRIGAGMQRTSRSMSIGLTAPILGFGAFIAKTAGDFEAGMNNVRAVSGATGEDFDKLKVQAKELGATTKFTAAQAAEGMGFLAMAGFEANEILGAMPGTLQLAASANLKLGDAADIVSNILTGYGKDVTEPAHINDVLVKTFASANTDLVGLGQAMKYVGPIAKAAGVQFEEVAAAIGQMGNAGIQGEMAGTALRGAIGKILNPTKQAAGLMEEMGLQFVDANGKLPLVDIIRALGPHAEDAGLFLQIFGQRAGPAMAALAGQGADSLAWQHWDEITEIVTKVVSVVKQWMVDKLGAVFEKVGAAVDMVTGFFAGMFDAVAGNSFVPDMIDRIEAEFGRLDKVMVEPAARAADAVSGAIETMAGRFGDELAEMVKTGEFSFDRLRGAAADLANQLFIQPFLSDLGSSGGIGSILSSIGGSLFGGGPGAGFGRALGGPVTAGRTYLVGEDGPELFRPTGSGDIFAGGAGGGTVNQIFNIQTPNANSFRPAQRHISRRAKMGIPLSGAVAA